MQNVLQKNQPSPPPVKTNLIEQKYVRVQAPKQPPVRHQKIIAHPKQKHLRYLPIGAVGVLFYLISLAIIFFIEPTKLQNILIGNLYLPFLIVTFLAHFFFFSYLFTNARRGLLMGIFLTWALFLRLTQTFSLPLLGAVLLPLMFIEVIVTIGSWQQLL